MQTAITVQTIVQAVIAYFDHDPERVMAFCRTNWDRLYGVHPLIDGVLDELTDWYTVSLADRVNPQFTGEEWGGDF